MPYGNRKAVKKSVRWTVVGAKMRFSELFVSRNRPPPSVSLRGALARRGNPLVPLSLLRCTSGVSPGDCHGPNGPRNDMVVFTWLRRFKPVNKLGFMELLAPHPSLPCVKGGGTKCRRDCRSTKCEFAYISGKSVTFYRTIPQSASLTAPFTQGGLWQVRQFEHLAKLKFELPGRETRPLRWDLGS